jgi:hypothetical protein
MYTAVVNSHSPDVKGGKEHQSLVHTLFLDYTSTLLELTS